MGLILLGLFSCDENQEIGLDLEGNQVLSTFYTDTITLNTSVVILDSINTTNAAIVLAGGVEDSRFGFTKAEGYSQLSMGIATNLNFGEGATFDSITMRLNHPYIYGDSATQQTYEIHELLEKIDTIAYYSFDKIGESGIGSKIGEVTFAPTDDSLDYVNLRLSDAFGQKIFDKSGLPELSNQESFAQFIQGIRIATPNNSTNKTILGFNPSGNRSFVTIHFQGPSGDTLAPQIFTFSLGRGYNSIIADLQGSSHISGLDKDTPLSTNVTNQECMIQAGTGIATLVEFPNLTNLGEGKRVLVNRAELFFRPLDVSSNDNTKLPPEALFLRVANEDKSAGGFINGELSGNAAVSQYNSSGRAYPSLRITTYIQEVINGNAPHNGVFLTLTPTLDRETVNQVAIGDANHPTSAQMQLQVYYTILEE